MDTMRGQFSDIDSPHEEHSEDMHSTTESGSATAGRDERRMQVRAYNFWASLLGDRTFPRIEDLHPEQLDDFGPNSVLLDFAEGIENPLVGFVGSRLAEECDVGTSIQRLADVPSRSLLSRITDHYMQILANEAPIGFEAEFVNQRGTTILYRGILLPFSREDTTIDAIFGVINWKTLDAQAAQARTDGSQGQRKPAGNEQVPAMLRETAPMTEWADGPADFDLADPDSDALELPAAQFGLSGAAFYDDVVPFHATLNELADWLAAARADARAALGSEHRSRQALYAAIGRAYDFSLAAQDDPDAYAEMLADAEITVQERAPLVPVVKLVFGADYDKTRITEFATALAHGQRLDLPCGGLADLLLQTPGGLKAIVRAERDLRRAEAGDLTALRPRHEQLLDALRKLPPRSLAQAAQGSEFSVLVARRAPDGRLLLLGEITDDDRLLDRAARHLLDEG